MTIRRIMTSYSRKPVPSEQFDWLASFDGDEPDEAGHMLVGSGATEREAIDDLIEKSGASQPFQLVKPGATS